MTARTEKQITDEALAALAELDDEAFWEAVAAYGYVRPEPIDPDQARFWTRRWVTGELEADLSIAEGRMIRHDSTEEFLAALEQAARAADARRG